MDPDRLRLLRELGDRGSVTAVAAALHVSASAVSQQLQALQARFPVPLTARSGRTLVLTDAGRALATASIDVDRALAQAQNAVDAFHEHGDREVSVSAFHSAGLALFAPLLAEVGGRHRLALSDADVATSDFPALTADHDLVIAHRLPHEPHWPTDRLMVAPLFVEPLDVALRADHPLARQAEIRPDQLRAERWIGTHVGFPLTGVLDVVGALAGGPLDVAHRINEFFVAAQVIRSGDAVGIMPRTTTASLATDGMVLRPIAGVRLVRHVDVLVRPDVHARTAVRDVTDALRRVATELQVPQRT